MELTSTVTQSSLSGSNSRTSSNSEIEKELIELDISGGTKTNTLKKRISSSRTPTRKAKRIKFYKNGDKFYPGLTIPVSYEKYKSYESLTEDLTRLLEGNVTLTGAIRIVYSLEGKKIDKLDDLEDGKSYVCSCNNEIFKKIEYTNNHKTTNRLSRINRPTTPDKNIINALIIRDTVVFPRIVTLIRNGTKPRKIMKLLINKRNSPTFDHVLIAITQCVKLDTGCVRKVFTLSGVPVLKLADFFAEDDVFFVYGNERVNGDFDLEPEEAKLIRPIKKIIRNGNTKNGIKPKMPIKSHNETFVHLNEDLIGAGIRADLLPEIIQKKYVLDSIIGDGNFAAVVKVKEMDTNGEYALKIIDKSRCKGKEHYIEAEVRVMKKLRHPNIISLFLNVDTSTNMYLILELVSGGDLFDAITKVTRFSESRSKLMIRNLASATAYLHSLSIVHRDIKPENLLVQLDSKGNITQLKLADFGLACEVTEPLFAVCGTPTYVAPEILMETGYGLKIDVWAAGVILYILLCGFPPFISADNQQEPLFDAILTGIFEFPEPYWNGIGDGVRDLINNMLQSDPELRFSSEDVLDHFWLLENDDYL